MKRILLASGVREIDNAIRKFDNYESIDSVEYRKDVLEACKYHQPDIVLVGEALSGQELLIGVLLQLVKEFPTMRIVYLAGFVDLKDEQRVNALGVLVMAGIYDIIHERKLSVGMLKNILDNPKDQEAMSYLLRKNKETANRNKETVIEFEAPVEENQDEDNDILSNLYVVSSIKPGTGKSFLSTNLAAAIANFGEDIKGRRPRVALIEADLQNLSVGTLLGIEDDKKNLKTVMDKIATIINTHDELVGDMKQIEEVNAFIRSSFKPYSKIHNLEALVGSQLTFEEIENVKAEYYVYLIESIIKDYDVVIIDSNSSLTHVTTYPLLHMAKNCFYVLNLDFNNVRNNVRYRTILQEIGISDKVKYVLNEDVENDPNEFPSAGVDIEKLIFTAEHLDDSEFKLEARIPTLPKTVFLNRLYEGTPVVLDNNDYTLKARYEIMKVANEIFPLKNLSAIEEELMAKNGKKKKSFFR